MAEGEKAVDETLSSTPASIAVALNVEGEDPATGAPEAIAGHHGSSAPEFAPVKGSRSRSGCCPLPLWALLAIGVGTLLLGTGLSVFGIMFVSNVQQRQSFNGLLANSALAGMRTASETLVSNLREAATAVRYMDPQASNCSMPASGYQPTALTRLFNALSYGAPERQLGSIGVIKYTPAPQMPYGGKVSWQVASGDGCPDYIYAFADPAHYPAFYGYCVSAATLAVDTSHLAYNGTDWGLKQTEAQLLASPPGTELFLPVFALLGSFTLTLETGYACAPAATTPYALVFAEQSLAQLGDALQVLVNGTNVGVAFIAEQSTGFLVASSLAGQTQTVANVGGVPTPERVSAVGAPDGTIRAAAALLPAFTSLGGAGATVTAQSAAAAGSAAASGALWVAAEVFSPGPGLDWVLVVAIPESPFLQAAAAATGLAIGLSVAVIAAGLAVMAALLYCCVTRPMARMGDWVKRVELAAAGATGGGGPTAAAAGSVNGDVAAAPIEAWAPADDEPLLAGISASGVREVREMALSLRAARQRRAGQPPAPPAAAAVSPSA